MPSVSITRLKRVHSHQRRSPHRPWADSHVWEASRPVRSGRTQTPAICGRPHGRAWTRRGQKARMMVVRGEAESTRWPCQCDGPVSWCSRGAWACCRNIRVGGTIPSWGVRHSMTDRRQHAQPSHIAIEPGQPPCHGKRPPMYPASLPVPMVKPLPALRSSWPSSWRTVTIPITIPRGPPLPASRKRRS